MTWGVPASISAAIRQPAPADHSFTPYSVPLPSQLPSIYVDPALQAQAIQNGSVYSPGVNGGRPTGTAVEDQATALQRLAAHLGIDSAAINLQASRSIEDFRTLDSRAGEDRESALGALSRGYKNLAGQQLQTGNAAGVLRGGYLAQAAAKRDANQAIDQRPIETSYARAHEDAQRGIGRAGQDRDIGITNLNTGYLENTQDVNRTFDRTAADIGRSNIAIGNQQSWQATQNGYVAPPRPSNEFGSGADSRRVVLTGTERIVYAPDGHVISRSPR